jgi:hypothetical protein
VTLNDQLVRDFPEEIPREEPPPVSSKMNWNNFESPKKNPNLYQTSIN